MTRISSNPSVVSSAVRAPLRSISAFVATVDPWMTSAVPAIARRAIPFMIASSGWRGVDSSLNISILPRRIMMKSVNVPPVSTPILEIDLRDILDEFWNDRFDILDRSLRVALPRECLNVGAHCIEPVNGDFAHPCKVLVRRRVGGNVFDPLEYPLTFFFISPNLKDGSFGGVDTQFNIVPPAGLNHAQIQHCFEDVDGGKITT